MMLRKVIPPISKRPSQFMVRTSPSYCHCKQMYIIMGSKDFTSRAMALNVNVTFLIHTSATEGGMQNTHTSNTQIHWCNLSRSTQRLQFVSMSQTACRQPAPTTWRLSVSSPRAPWAAGSPSTKRHSSTTARRHRRKVEGQTPTLSYHPLPTHRAPIHSSYCRSKLQLLLFIYTCISHVQFPFTHAD